MSNDAPQIGIQVKLDRISLEKLTLTRTSNVADNGKKFETVSLSSAAFFRFDDGLVRITFVVTSKIEDEDWPEEERLLGEIEILSAFSLTINGKPIPESVIPKLGMKVLRVLTREAYGNTRGYVSALLQSTPFRSLTLPFIDVDTFLKGEIIDLMEGRRTLEEFGKQ